MTALHAGALPVVPARRTTDVAPAGGVEDAAIVLATAAVGLLVVLDGSPWWRLVRLGTVVSFGLMAATAMRTGTARTRVAIPAIAGVVATAAGAGIGIPFALKTGFGIEAVAGIVALVAGVVLLGRALVAGVRRARGWRKLVAVPIAWAVLQFGVLPGVAAVAATNVPRTRVGSVTPADRGLPYADVSFHTVDGVRLSGWYVPSRNRAAVVLAHGSGSTRSAVLDQAVVIARHGYGVLLYDARGHGRSAGRAMDFGWYGDADVSAAVSYVSHRPGVDANRIAAVGLSMGGEEAIGAAASDGRIAAVVAEGATTRVAADSSWLPHDLVGMVKRGQAWLTYSVAGMLTDAARPRALRAAVRAVAPRRVLLIEGKQEDEIAAGRALRRAAPANVELWALPDTAHTKGLKTHPREWERRVVGFLDAALGR